MTIWLALWVSVAAVEAVLYAAAGKKLWTSPLLRWFCGGALAIVLVSIDLQLIRLHWHTWIWVVVFTPYRLINIARFVYFRLSAQRIGAVALRSHWWLVVLQALSFALAVVLQRVELVYILAFLAAFQLVVAASLLRSTMQTWDFARPRKSKNHYADSELPSLSVLIPARDETTELEHCLSSLIASTYPKLEIIVLDDCSVGKRTAEIIRSYAHEGVRFIQGLEPPEHWLAKNFGYDQLWKAASGELLLFCGVDAQFTPNSLRAMVETLLDQNKDMLSVLPTRKPDEHRRISFLQPIRYYWELCLPRRVFKRPPVLSTCWLITADALTRFGGFASVAQSVSPEAHFARKAVIADSYIFVRSNPLLTLYSTKTLDEQYNTTVRLRYPQLHRRLELVVVTTLFEMVFLVGPFVGLVASVWLEYGSLFAWIWGCAVAAIQVMYYHVGVFTRLNHAMVAIGTVPFAFLTDICVVHVSLLRYEFGEVSWRGRSICLPVMRVEPALPKLPE